MSATSSFEFSIGLRHVLEDSLALLRGEDFSKDRKKLVLTKVGDFMSNAKKGSDVIGSAVFVNTPDSAQTVEAYALLFHHLSRSFPDLADKIQNAADVLKQMDRSERIDKKRRGDAEDLIETLLDSLNYEDAVSAFNPVETSQLM
ncbi:hypothetical protein QRQ56_15305 [Bradyrhizobium sp. U531]|uniref:hypothetical protein n=1 Tax=Bradyrhizobium sp. U531 TaxID=3053458 RepID=UPI003F42F7BE